ncbi:MAG: bifunctional diguanylate cyclase/phosphodiesterase [Christensenellaceae bacterium]|jgi:EAL domain-containing protein (putative c-di-GMP-specific phosphodiesterase class I)/GGDEF domain-containing protein|nr:bifunctional diguanylate cyclase/phosphodiesterase [Christensenellaceae bacterium]
MKKYYFRFFLFVIVILLAISAITVVYMNYYSNTVHERYEAVYEESIDNARAHLDQYVTEAFQTLEELQDGEHFDVPTGYYAIGTLGRKEIKKHEAPASIKAESINDTIFNYVSGSALKDSYGFSYPYVMTFSTFFDNDLVIYSKPTNNPDEYILLYEKLEDFNKKISVLNLDNIIMVDDNGLVMASHDTFKYDKLYSEASTSAFIPSEFGDMDTNTTLRISLDGVPLYLIKTKMDVPQYYVVGYINSQVIDDALKADNIRNGVFVGLTILFSFGGAVLIFTTYFVLSRNYVNVSIAKGKYSLFVGKGGDIIKRNRKFKKEYKYSTISASLMNNELGVPNTVGDSDLILRMINRAGEQTYLRFLSTKTLYGYRMLGTDATAFMNVYLEARYLSNCDYLTRLPNLTQLDIDYQKACFESGNEQFCFEFIDIIDMERYKVMFGQSFYDQLKINFSKRLNNIFNGMVYQSSDTRFLIFTRETTITKFLTTELDKYSSLINAPIRVETQFLILEFKGGHSKPFLAKERPLLETMLNQARLALTAATESAGRSIVGYYDTLMHGDSVKYENRDAVLELLESDLLTLNYQPQQNLHTGAIVGFEALIRPKKKLNMPILNFIEHAERNGSIIELGNFVYRTAMSFAKKIEHTGVLVAMNVSPVQLMQEGFVSTFLHFYKSFDLKPHSIAIEITESFLMSNYNRVLRILNMLSSAGVDIHLDDFGTVYSSMLYLKRLPISTIKIDREFIRDINFNGYSKMVVGIIAQSATHLKLKSIAEGVETSEQAETLRELKCDIIQGYHVGRAIEDTAAFELLGITPQDVPETPEIVIAEPPKPQTPEDFIDSLEPADQSTQTKNENPN